ncbi:MAG: hypothetical protein AMXMBFR57_06330 [Acidimicrobiia bacterium]
MQPTLFDVPLSPEPEPRQTPPDQAARDFAVNPAEHVVLEASAGTGKTHVLVERYVRLIREGIAPRQILAITFTRKAAAEMRERILRQLRDDVPASTLADVQITTIDAFCFGLLREFPLEADVDPGFEIADETEMARFSAEALEVTFRKARGLVTRHEPVRLLLTKVKPRPLRMALARLLDSRHLAEPAVASFVRRTVTLRSAEDVAHTFVARLRDVCSGAPALLHDGPAGSAEFGWVAADLRRLFDPHAEIPVSEVPQLQRRFERYFLTKDGKPRKRLPSFVKADHYASPAAKKRHEAAFQGVTSGVAAAIEALEREVDGLLAIGLQMVLQILVREYQRLLDEHSVLDFAAMLSRAVSLLERQEEFARSRLKLESRYRHLLVDEFQDTSRLQWRLVDLLVAAWGEGEGVVDGPTSIFIVGDRKQSIYRFRHAEVVLLDEAARRIGALRPGRRVRQSITTNFRSVAGLLAFVNTMSDLMQGDPDLDERFVYRETDWFPVAAVDNEGRRDGEPVLGVIAQPSMAAAADAVATEISRLLGSAVIRPKDGPPRPALPDDVAILFRARAGHQVYQEALERRGIQTYVYKGLGFFDAPEVQDLQALLRVLAQPESDLRTAEFLRSRFVRLSDDALALLAPGLAAALESDGPVPEGMAEVDRVLLLQAREGFGRWRALADRLPASALLDIVIRESAYAAELRGTRRAQARENIKKVRALVRRVENRGYSTLGRLAEYFETLRAGDESHAIVEARGCVQLMTMHAAKGLEFPIVFLVNLQNPGRGRHQGISVIERSVDGESEVAFRSTPGTKLEERREDEELRRLLYVAVTRARDRLYLSAQVGDDGQVRNSRRSLAGLLPQGLREVFSQAASAAPEQDEVFWGTEKHRFAFRVCRPGAPVAVASPAHDDESLPGIDRIPLQWPVAVRSAAQMPMADGSEPVRGPGGEGGRSDRLVGTLVHRLLQWAGARTPTDAEWAMAWEQLVPVERLVDVDDPVRLREVVLQAAAGLRRHPRLTQLLSTGRPWFEVPFSLSVPGPVPGSTEVIRGAIDCVIEREDGGLQVVEIKTGRARPEHEAQLAIYLQALRSVYTNVQVDGELVYFRGEA